MAVIKFKQAFVERYTKLTDFSAYERAVAAFPQKSIRVNTIKATIPQVKKSLESQGWVLTQVPWCKDGFYITHQENRRDISTTREHKNGFIFIQRSVSMIPPLVLAPSPKDIVLDMCAAPGAKTTQLAALMANQGLIIANESSRSRLAALIANLQRCSVMNTIVVNHSGDKLPMNQKFDKILLDAPCSSTGLIKGNTERTRRTLKTWNPNTVRRLAKLQRKLLEHAYQLLKDNGILVYSTCSLEPEEDELLIEEITEKTNMQLETISLDILAEKRKWLKIWPQDNNTEGFFVAKLHKS